MFLYNPECILLWFVPWLTCNKYKTIVSICEISSGRRIMYTVLTFKNSYFTPKTLFCSWGCQRLNLDHVHSREACYHWAISLVKIIFVNVHLWPLHSWNSVHSLVQILRLIMHNAEVLREWSSPGERSIDFFIIPSWLEDWVRIGLVLHGL